MSSVEYLRQFVNERLTAAAEEIFGVFQQKISEYEEEINRQRKLLGVIRQPVITLQRTELPQQNRCEEVPNQQLCKQERYSSLDQEDKESPQIKLNPDDTLEGSVDNMTVIRSVASDPDSELQPLSNSSQKTMSAVEYLRQFVNERLTAAAEEIFEVFQQKISEYEEEIDRQRKLLDVIRRPVISLQRTELPQQNPCKEEEVSHQRLCNQERYSSLNQEDKECPQIKVKQEEPCSSQKLEQLELKKETDTFMLTSLYEENVHSEVQTVDMNPDDTLEGFVDNMTVISSVASDPDSELHPLSNSSQVASITGQKGEKCEDSGSFKDVKLRQKKCLVNNVCNSNMFITHFDRDTGKKSFTCNVCGKEFKFMSTLQTHLRIHTGEKPYVCTTCGKDFKQNSQLSSHMRIHTGEKPFICTICGKDFRQSCHLSYHMKSHTVEKPYACTMCGKGFNSKHTLTFHMRRHKTECSHVQNS